MAGELSGRYGKFFWGADPTGSGNATPAEVLSVRNWKERSTSDPPKVNSMSSDGFDEYIPGFVGWTVTAEGYWNRRETKLDGNPPAITAGMPGVFQGIVDSVEDPSKYCEGWGIIRSAEVDVNVDGSVTWSLEIQGSGELRRYL